MVIIVSCLRNHHQSITWAAATTTQEVSGWAAAGGGERCAGAVRQSPVRAALSRSRRATRRDTKMPLFSEHITNMYYSGSPSYSAPYSSYSSVLPLGSSYSASYLNPGGSYSTHSSIGGYTRPTPVSSRWVTSSGRNYAPMLSTISERGTSSPSRISSPRRIPYTNRMYATPSYTPRPININTADIDVSKDRYKNKVESCPPLPPPTEPEKDSGPFMPRVDGKPETGIDSSPGIGAQRSTIRRGRTVVRLHTIKRKDRDSPRKPREDSSDKDGSPSADNKTTENMITDEPNEPVRWREKLSEDLTYKDKREKKTIGAKLVEKFIVKDKDSDSEGSTKESRRKAEAIASLPVSPLEAPKQCLPSRSPDRRCSIEMLVEQANVLDSLIRGENLSTASLDLSKVGISENEEGPSQRHPSIKRRKSNDPDNPLQTTKSDHSLHESLKSLKDPKHFSKRRSLKKSSSGGSICRLDSITEFPREPIVMKLPAIDENKISIEKPNVKPKLKAKITTSVEISPPISPLKFKIDVTVEETPRSPKKEIVYSTIVEDVLIQPEEEPKQEKVQWTYTAQESKLLEETQSESPEPDNGNFWDKIGKRETVYLMKRKQYINDTRERNRRAIFWFPDEEEENEINHNEQTGTLNMNTEDDFLQSRENVPSASTSTEDNLTEQEQKVAPIFHDASDQFTPTSDSKQKDSPKVKPSLDDKLTSSKSDVALSSKTNEPKIKALSDKNKSLSDKKEPTAEIKNKINKTPANEPKALKLQEKTPETQSKLNETKSNLDNSSILETKTEKSIPDLKPTQQNDTISNISKDENVTSDNKTLDVVTKESPAQIDKNEASPNAIKKVSKDNVNPKLSDPVKKKSIEKPKVLNEEKIAKKENKIIENNEAVKNVCPIHGVTDQKNKPDLGQEKNIPENKIENKVSPPGKVLKTKTDAVKKSSPIKDGKLAEKPSSDKSKAALQKKSNPQTMPVAEDVNKEAATVVKPEVDTKTNQQEGGSSKEDTKLSEISSSVEMEPTKQEDIPSSSKDETNVIDTPSDNNLCQKVPEVPIVIEIENIPNKEDSTETKENENKGENEKPVSQPLVMEKLEVKPPTPVAFIKPPSPRRPVKEEAAVRPLIATPRPLQKKTPQIIHSSSSSESSSEESSSDEDDDADESNASDDSTEFFECETNPDGRTSTGSNDSGFDSSAPTSPAGFVHVKKGGESAGPSTTPASSDAAGIQEQELEQSTAYSLFRKTGRFTPPARSIPRFRKYNIEDFHFIKVLGKGSFGKVLLTELRDTEYYYAVKCLKKDVVLEDDDVECTLIERKVLALGTNHPYLCHLFATFQTDSHLFFVMEYLNGGDLMFHIQQSGRFPEARARFYAAEIVSGLKFLHKRGIVYRDLKLDNILLDFDGHVRIADFGMCKLQIYLDKTADTFCGTPDYMAPEIIKGLKYSQTVDWWSFGVLLYEMLIGQSPFSGCDEDELFWSICNEMPSYPRFLSQEALTILTRLLDKDARTRLGGTECMYGDVRDQDFFHAIHWDRLERRELEAPFRPRVRHPLDTQYFDRAFTGERPRLTAVEPTVLRSMDQEPFRGFSYTNPNATDR